MNENIYKSPESELVDESAEQNLLASRWQRLWASLLDSLILSIFTLPVMYFTGGFNGFPEGIKPSSAYMLLIGIFGFIVFFIINANLLVTNGQTVGKRVLGIKITTLDGKLPTLKGHLLKRYAVFFLPGQIPVIGQLFSTVNILFIFGKQKRCIHDLVADTKVVTS